MYRRLHTCQSEHSLTWRHLLQKTRTLLMRLPILSSKCLVFLHLNCSYKLSLAASLHPQTNTANLVNMVIYTNNHMIKIVSSTVDITVSSSGMFLYIKPLGFSIFIQSSKHLSPSKAHSHLMNPPLTGPHSVPPSASLWLK